MSYVDGFVAAVPTANRERYREHAEIGARLFKEYGALAVVECWGDNVPPGEITSFSKAVMCKPDETVVFAWVLWASKQAHDEAWAKLMKDPRMSPEANPMPFDGKRLIYGSFETLLQA
jgi:uncharacterized protein YbaA (DUF1428 family)